ncbi:beta-ketoacyl synthase N-terminal-like domain-containing protein [Uliginosibacterium sp. H1]|uniref:beta-ketoacyl synthase N-terminal-like domain-containing protein n=1 Tax=Uliginosibacterium sp. H1 TaxID=3114757 RepID=UPI002E17DB58|nr:beta-ketoacyl synthase N-terminal-like domain-containing protein [Uliginosibacterium sp. H1]
MSALAIRGRGLACGLGVGADAAAAAVGTLPVPLFVTLGEGLQRPFLPIRGIPDDATITGAAAWHARTRALIRDVVAQALGEASGAALELVPRDGALLIASSSLHVGAVEAGQLFRPHGSLFAQQVKEWLDWQGPVYCFSTACTSSIVALSAARALLASGAAPSALVLGVELANRLSLSGFQGMQLLSPDAARPFGLGRNGLVLGEAVAALHCVVASGNEAGWRITGSAHIVDGSDPAGASRGALLRACREALEQAGRTPAEVELVKVQAAGSPGNDALEAAVLHELFDHMPALVSLKPSLGHCLGASGAVELALLCAALDAGALPPVTHEPDPALDLRLATRLDAAPRCVLAIIVGFGGGHAAAVLECRQ